MLDFCYRLITHIGRSPVRLWLTKRLAAGKEDPARWRERLGKSQRYRPRGIVLWCHAASVGESLSLLALMERLLVLEPRPSILVTTGTVSSARLLNERLPALNHSENIIHQYAPFDRMRWVKRFLDHWRPDFAIWVESELWPNLLSEIKARGIPAVLMNGRMSKRSYNRWGFAKKWVHNMLSSFEFVLAQSEGEMQRYQSLGAWPVAYVGNLKCAASPPPAREEACAALKSAISDRPCWLYSSTHPGEEEVALAIHRQLAVTYPRLLTVIAPRHPRRAEDIKALMRSRGMRFSVRSEHALPGANDDIYLADTLGELGVFYRTIPISVIGGSFVPVGGHNPIEAAQLGSAILFGPHMFNFTAICESLLSAKAATEVGSQAALAEALSDFLKSPAKAARQISAAYKIARRDAASLDRVMDMLAPLLRTIGLRYSDNLQNSLIHAQDLESNFQQESVDASA